MADVKILDDSYKSRSVRVYTAYAPTLRSARGGLKVLYVGEQSEQMYGIIKREGIKNKVPLSINELFSGIGAQRQGIENTGLFDCNVVVTSDIARYSVLSYAAVHNNLTSEFVESYTEDGVEPSLEKMVDYLTERNIGYNFEKNVSFDWSGVKSEIKKYYVACKISNNIGDIARVAELPYADLWTYSFPCTDISIAGEKKGIVKGVTRSGLLYEVERLLRVAQLKGTLPKYLMLENVKQLLSKQFKSIYDDWVSFLDALGYKTYTSVLNAKDCGIPQNRERVFGISIRKDIVNGEFLFPYKFDSGVRLEHILDSEVDSCYICTEEAAAYLKTDKQLCDLDGLKNGEAVLRRLTPNECWRLMGFEDKEFEKARAIGMSDTKLYEQAGNSIVTNCVELLFEHLYKAQYEPNMQTTDEENTALIVI